MTTCLGIITLIYLEYYRHSYFLVLTEQMRGATGVCCQPRTCDLIHCRLLVYFDPCYCIMKYDKF